MLKSSTKKQKSPKRTRITSIKLSNEMRKHSPLKKGLTVKDEDEAYEDYNKIMPRLYLGNKQAAKNKDFINENGIKAILNCSKEKDIPNYFCESNIEYMRVPVDDSLKQKDFDKMFLLMPSIVEFIHKHVDILKQPLFVHCYAGRQRSVCSIVCYLMAKHNMTPSEACKFVLNKRKEAFHYGLSVNFDQTINKYYKELQKCKK
jgi:protein-tyrosine phosphatase